MTVLSKMFRETVSKSKDLRMSMEATINIGYPTGFANFDFMNGTVDSLDNDDLNIHQKYLTTGVTDGSHIMIIGRSGCGKSTFAEQIAANIVRPFPDSEVFIDVTESMGTTFSRRKVITGFTDKEIHDRYIIRNAGITSENFYKRINMIYNMKMENKDKFMYDTGKVDINGEPVYKFKPTAYILDSIPMLVPDNIEEKDELSGNMAGAAVAKSITLVFKLIMQKIKAANIILITINHILPDVSITGMPKKPDLAYLKVGERLPGGKTTTYSANTIIRLDDANKLKAEEKYKVNGSLVKTSLVKSRGARANQETILLFNQSIGFDPILSSLIFMQNRERVHGAGIGLYIDDNKDMKFSMGNFKDKMNNPDFYKMFIDSYMDELYKVITIPLNPSFELDTKMNQDLSSIAENKLKEITSTNN